MANTQSILPQLSGEDGVATAAAGAATLNATSGLITTESLSTAAGADYTLTLTNSRIGANSNILVIPYWGSTTQGVPAVKAITPSAGSATIVIRNIHATLALNGTLKIFFLVI